MAAPTWSICILFLFINPFLRACEAAFNYNLSSSTVTTTGFTSQRITSRPTTILTSTTDSQALITSCVPGQASINIDYYIPEHLRSLPLESKIAYTNSVGFKLGRYVSTILGIIAGGSIGDAALSYASSVFDDYKNDVTSLYGAGGEAMIALYDFQTDQCLYKTCFEQYVSQSSSHAEAQIPGPFFYTASAPCCHRCQIFADNVDVEYWPTPAPSPPVSVLIDVKNNFTFTSPSVYARFTNLYAQNSCGKVGTQIPFTRIAFRGDELRTSYFPLGNAEDMTKIVPFFGVWRSINYADFDAATCLCTKDCPTNQFNGLPETYTCRRPQLSVHPKVSALDPMWAACKPDILGIFDPPIALPRAESLTAPKTTSASSTPVGPRPTPTPVVPAPVDSPSPPVVDPTSTSRSLITLQSSSSAAIASSSQSSPVQISSLRPITTQGTSTTSSSAPQGSIPVIGLPLSPSLTVIGSQIFTLGALPSTVIINGTPVVLPPTSTATLLPNAITVNGQTVTKDSNSNFVIGTQTLSRGSAVTISGSIISVDSGSGELTIKPLQSSANPISTTRSAATTLSTSGGSVEFVGSAAKHSLTFIHLIPLVVCLLTFLTF